MRSEQKLVLAFFLISTFSFALSLPPFSEVETHNNALAPSLVPFEKAASPNSRSPSFSDPVEFFSIEVFTAMPSVDSRVSSRHPPKILWGWSERHAQKLEQEFGEGNCSKVRITLTSTGSLQAEYFAATAEFEGKSSAADLEKGAKNPFETGFSSAQLEAPLLQDSETNLSIPQFMKINISGSLLFPYTERTETELLDCRDVCSDGICSRVCSCSTHVSTSEKIFRKYSEGHAQFTVENGNITFLLLKPILREQLSSQASLQSIFFSRRLPFELAFDSEGGRITSALLYNFSTAQTSEGVMLINSSRLPLPENLSEKELFIQPTQLQDSSDAFSHAYSFSSAFSNSSGKSTLTVSFTDHFGDEYARAYSLRTRELSYISFNNNSEAFLTDENNRALPGRQLQKDALGVVFKGDDSYRPSAAAPSSSMQAALSPPATAPTTPSPAQLSPAFPPILILSFFAAASLLFSGKIFGFGFLQQAWQFLNNMFPKGKP